MNIQHGWLHTACGGGVRVCVCVSTSHQLPALSGVFQFFQSHPCLFLVCLSPACDWPQPKMMSPKNKAKKKPPKDSMTLLPCFYFVEVCVCVFIFVRVSVCV